MMSEKGLFGKNEAEVAFGNYDTLGCLMAEDDVQAYIGLCLINRASKIIKKRIESNEHLSCVVFGRFIPAEDGESKLHLYTVNSKVWSQCVNLFWVTSDLNELYLSGRYSDMLRIYDGLATGDRDG